jgi:hypothetical protein
MFSGSDDTDRAKKRQIREQRETSPVKNPNAPVSPIR